jgi:hypothetical protein
MEIVKKLTSLNLLLTGIVFLLTAVGMMIGIVELLEYFKYGWEFLIFQLY